MKRKSPFPTMDAPRPTNDERAANVAKQIVEAFREGRVPKALSLIFIRRNRAAPSSSWSLRNRFIAALHGHSDARGFRQWQQAGRTVRKGERAFYILGPRTLKLRQDRPELGLEAGDALMVGVVPIPVFGFDQTDGEPMPEATNITDEAAFISGLPFLEVARSWGLQITTYEGERDDFLGRYVYGTRIALGVRNLSTWAHELTHAADDRLGTLRSAPKLDREVVAELGASVLLECAGETYESDRGGAWSYINFYCHKYDADPLSVCEALLERVIACVTLVLDTAEQLTAEIPLPSAIPASPAG
jgi:hypothetical protein